MAVGLLENRARREKSTSNVTTVTDWWWRTGRGGRRLGRRWMREGGVEGEHRMKMERPGVWGGWFWEGTCGHTYGPPLSLDASLLRRGTCDGGSGRSWSTP